MLTGHFNASDRAIQRYHGYLDAMRAHALTPMTPIEVPRHTGLISAHLEAFADPQQRPSALFCSNDLLALAAMRDLRGLGLRVPEDVSVMGFDGIPLGEMMSPVLASAVQPSEQIGEVALRTLVAAIGQTEGSAGPVSQILAHTIRHGGSVRLFS
jgi:DNA-binding LacI/PurR family transcriptional regulator